MSPEQPEQQPDPAGESEWARRQRLEAVFGDALPDTTRDERDDDPAERRSGEDPAETWLKSQVPPHHG